MRKTFGAVAIAIFLSSCMANGPKFEAAPVAPSGQVLVYIYRVPAFAFAAVRTTFLIDEVEVGHLANGGYTRIYLPVGQHVLKQRWDMLRLSFEPLPPATRLRINLQPGQVYYYNLQAGISGNRLEWRISGVDPYVGGLDITRYRFQPPIRETVSN